MEPVGPLPPSVYWRRRCLALGAAVLVVVLFGWGIVALVGGSSDPATTANTASPAVDAPPPEPRPASFVGPGGLPTAAPGEPGAALDPRAALIVPPGGGSGPLLGGHPSSGAATSGAATPGSPSSGGSSTAPDARTSGPAASRAAGTPTAGQTAGSQPRPPAPTATAPAAGPGVTPSAPAAAPRPCADGVIRVAARTDKPRYAPGERPVLSIVITNAGPVPCLRDLDAARQAVAVVRKPGDGLWGSNDCSPAHSDDVRTLAPGQSATFSVRWSGRTSTPGCRGERGPVPAGAYQLLARLDGTISDPVPFILG